MGEGMTRTAQFGMVGAAVPVAALLWLLLVG
jgi:hypothetical protein